MSDTSGENAPPARPRAASCSLAALCAAALAAATLAGCGQAEQGRIPVFKTAGKITFQSQPLAGAFIVLHPQGAAAEGAEVPRPTAHVQPDGSFAATTFDSADGAPAGQYVVTVEWRRLVNVGGEWTPGPNLLPGKYSSPATSDVIIHVAEGQNDLTPIALR